jgi:hypothetical protein
MITNSPAGPSDRPAPFARQGGGEYEMSAGLRKPETIGVPAPFEQAPPL